MPPTHGPPPQRLPTYRVPDASILRAAIFRSPLRAGGRNLPLRPAFPESPFWNPTA